MSPLAKVYKAKYFSNGDYSTSTLGPKPSFTWRSLLSVRDIMKRAIRWKIGDLRTIRIWENNWLEHTWSRMPITPDLDDFPSATVSDLIDEDIGTWNILKVRSWFFNVDSEEILKMPLNNLNQADSIIWGPHPKGIFTVKTTYEFIHTLSQEASLGPTTSNPQHTFYKRFWKIKISGKIKHFLWKALNNNLPTTNKLRQRKVDIQPTCILYGTHEETVMHVLHPCSFTQEVNRILKITYMNGREMEFQDLFELKWDRLPPDRFRTWLTSLWMVWHQRNQRVHGEPRRSTEEIAESTLSFMAPQEASSGKKQEIRVPNF
ncbi:hypothetical protein LIER_43436 [Lithospermum erythrorhizon]|uniref:Reverse transcriptase zinc-binding domain-containing protein n=1 Tax=Lithospermum erythrorhizon TaxID=34254 RepID=A0AAV3Q7P5_LITER